MCLDWPADPTPPTGARRDQCPPAAPCWRVGRRGLTSERNDLVCAVAELQQDMSVGRMEKVQLLERSCVSLQPTGHTVRAQTHVLSQRQHQHQAQLLLTLDRAHSATHVSMSAQLILTDDIRTSAGILLTGLLPTPSFLQIAGLSAAGRRQIFPSGLAGRARKAEEAQLVLLRLKLSSVLPCHCPKGSASS